MIRSFIRNVSHNSRSAPLSTVNFAKKPVSPVAPTGATLFSEGALHLLQLSHQVCFCVHSASGVAQKKVDVAAGGRLIRFVTQRSRIGIVLASNHFDAEPFCPNLKLFNCCGAKSIGCREQYTMSIPD